MQQIVGEKCGLSTNKSQAPDSKSPGLPGDRPDTQARQGECQESLHSFSSCYRGVGVVLESGVSPEPVGPMRFRGTIFSPPFGAAQDRQSSQRWQRLLPGSLAWYRQRHQRDRDVQSVGGWIIRVGPAPAPSHEGLRKPGRSDTPDRSRRAGPFSRFCGGQRGPVIHGRKEASFVSFVGFVVQDVVCQAQPSSCLHRPNERSARIRLLVSGACGG